MVKTEFMRKCRHCGKFFYTEHRRGRVCLECDGRCRITIAYTGNEKMIVLPTEKTKPSEDEE